MNKRRAAPPALPVGLVATMLGVVGAEAAPPAAELARCAAIELASERLACYDALECAAISAPEQRLACYDALAKAAAARPQAAAARAEAAQVRAAKAAETGADDPASFGLNRRQTADEQGPQKISARVVRVSQDRQGTVSVALDNGQTWAVRERDPLLESGVAVTIRHAALGSYLLTTETRHSYRVQRLQ